jgi:hypothetical protein
MNLGTVGDILEDRERERIGPLENHANALPKLPEIDISGIDRLAVKQNISGHSHLRDDFVHSVDNTQECRLTTS